MNEYIDSETGEENPNLVYDKGTNESAEPEPEPQPEQRKVALIGNGRTLRYFEFDKISDDMDTVGMGLAYRHWYDINWFPDYYVNVDRELLNHNHQEIKKMIDEDKCKKGYFLSRSILKHYPELEDNEKVLFIEMFQEQRGNPFRYLLEWYCESAAFLFAVILGYNDINVLGIDLKYEDFVCNTDDNLIITDIPIHNPNYFRDDYQMTGDLYIKPNLEDQTHSWEHIVFILTGYTYLNRLPMNVYVWTTDEVVGLSKYFSKKLLKNFFS